MTSNHAVVWIDHHVARVIDLAADGPTATVIEALDPPRRIHQRRGIIGSGHAPTDPHYLDRVAADLGGIDRILVTGPGSAKDELVDRLRARHPEVAAHVVAVDTVDHPSDRQLAAHARRRFVALDQLDGLPVDVGSIRRR